MGRAHPNKEKSVTYAADSPSQAFPKSVVGRVTQAFRRTPANGHVVSTLSALDHLSPLSTSSDGGPTASSLPGAPGSVELPFERVASAPTDETGSQPSSPAPSCNEGIIDGRPSRLDSPNMLPNHFSRADLRPRGWDRFVIHPDNKIKAYFESLIVFCVLYTAVMEPFEITYNVEMMPLIDDMLDGLFIFDLGVQFFSGYHDSGGKRFPVLVLRTVALNYVRTWFLIDLVAAIPFDRFFSGAKDDVRVKFPGLIKIIRLLKLRRTIRKWNGLSYGPLLKVITIVCGWLLLAHWFACGWFVMGWYTCRSLANQVETNGPWVTQYWPQLTPNCTTGNPPDPGDFQRAVGLRVFDVHVRCLYWALATMSSMGYGNSPVAHSTGDMLYSIGTQVVGACLAAGIFSNVAQMINQSDVKNARYQTQLERVREFSTLHKLSDTMHDKLIGYHELVFSINHGVDLHQVASMFPGSVQQEVFFEEHAPRLRLVPMFQHSECDEIFIAALSRELRVQVLLDGDFAYKTGEVGDRMYFLKTGYMQIYGPKTDLVVATIGPGGYFGELALFSAIQDLNLSRASMGPNDGAREVFSSDKMFKRSGSARSLSDCILIILMKHDFQVIAERLRIDVQRMMAVATEVVRCRRPSFLTRESMLRPSTPELKRMRRPSHNGNDEITSRSSSPGGSRLRRPSHNGNDEITSRSSSPGGSRLARRATEPAVAFYSNHRRTPSDEVEDSFKMKRAKALGATVDLDGAVKERLKQRRRSAPSDWLRKSGASITSAVANFGAASSGSSGAPSSAATPYEADVDQIAPGLLPRDRRPSRDAETIGMPDKPKERRPSSHADEIAASAARLQHARFSVCRSASADDAAPETPPMGVGPPANRSCSVCVTSADGTAPGSLPRAKSGKGRSSVRTEAARDGSGDEVASRAPRRPSAAKHHGHSYGTSSETRDSRARCASGGGAGFGGSGGGGYVSPFL